MIFFIELTDELVSDLDDEDLPNPEETGDEDNNNELTTDGMSDQTLDTQEANQQQSPVLPLIKSNIRIHS